MNTIQIKEIDVTTGEESVKNANQKEKQSITALFEKNQKEQLEIETNALAKAAILDRIGLTADELKTILG